MFPNASHVVVHGGTFSISQTHHTSRGMDILMEWVATGAFHNSDELYDAPKCHPHTRVAVLTDIMEWVSESESAQDEFMMWLFGPAGAGKSAIAKRIAEISAERNELIADFFFSRTSPTRNTRDRLIATLAYQLTVSIPETRSYVEDAIERDPAIFHKNILTQLDTLLIKPFQTLSSIHIAPSQKLIIIDGLDECNDRKTQAAILEAISHSFTQHNLPIKFLVVSRPEPDLVSLFNCNEPLRSIHRRLALDDTYRPDNDIRLFFSDKFEHIKRTHLLRSTIPNTWPTPEMLEKLVAKSSGQFIYASTVAKFVESSCHRPTIRLNIILGISPPGTINPFAELDALYSCILASVDDIQLTLRALMLYVMTPRFVFHLNYRVSQMSPELFLSLEPGDIQLALMNLSSIVTYHERSREVDILHASFVDFLSDGRRSTIYYIDMASTCTDVFHSILQYVQGPDGIRAGDISLFRGLYSLYPWVPKSQLQSEISNFDVNAFIDASIRWRYDGLRLSPLSGSTIDAFDVWTTMLNAKTLEISDTKEALDRLNKSFGSRLHVYQSDWRLQLLVPLSVANAMYYNYYAVPSCRRLDILLEMDNHELHVVDRHALDLRHVGLGPRPNLISSHVDADTYASAALHCMRFLSNPPKYFEENECPEMGLMYPEWKETYNMTLYMLCILLEEANNSPELVKFISNHDIHPAVQNNFSADYLLGVNLHILVFLSRASVCVNWRIIYAIQSLVVNDQSPIFGGSDKRLNEPVGLLATWYGLHFKQRIDQCCRDAHSSW